MSREKEGVFSPYSALNWQSEMVEIAFLMAGRGAGGQGALQDMVMPVEGQVRSFPNSRKEPGGALNGWWGVSDLLRGSILDSAAL